MLWEGICTDKELDEMERHFIQDVERRPRLNEIMNEDNPHMIPKAVQREQRRARDDALRRPRWVPFQQRTRESLLEWETPDRPAYEQRPVRQKRAALKPWQKRLIGWGITWPGSTLVVWLLELHWHLGGWEQTLIAAASFLPCVLLLIWLVLLERATKRTRRRFLRKLFGGRR